MIRRVILPGAGGDDYTWNGRGVQIEARPGEKPRQQEPTQAVSSWLEPPPDPSALAEHEQLERERCLIGAWISGAATDEALDLLEHPEHRRIALALIANGDHDLPEAIAACRRAGVPPELTSGEIAEGIMGGYLPGCVRRWREQLQTGGTWRPKDAP